MEPEMRPLKKSDIPAIIEISKTTWGGHDHLPNLIGEWLENPVCHPYVLDAEGDVIGVANVRIIDEGRTAWLEGLRIHEKARQKGLAQRLTNHLCDISLQLRVKRMRLVTSGDNLAPIKLAASIGMKQMNVYQVFWKGYRRKITWRDESIKVEQIEPNNVMKFLEKNPDLLPLRALVHHWDVYDATPEKISELSKSAQYWGGGDDSGAVFSISGEEPSSDGPEWIFSLFATSPKAFTAGLSKNLEVSQESGIRNLMCIHSPNYIPMYQKIQWLKHRNHEISLVLHERYLE